MVSGPEVNLPLTDPDKQKMASVTQRCLLKNDVCCCLGRRFCSSGMPPEIIKTKTQKFQRLTWKHPSIYLLMLAPMQFRASSST